MKQISKIRIPIVYIMLMFFAFATMNLVNRYNYFVYIALIFFCLKPMRRFKLDAAPIILLFILGLSWMLFSTFTTGSIFGLIKPFTYLLCYMIGASMMNDDDDYGKDKMPLKLFYIMVTAVSAGSMVHYLLNWIINVGSQDRNTMDIWTKAVMAATGQAALACLPLGLAVACLFIETNKKIKIASIITIILVLGYNLILSGRTLILMFLILLAAGFLHNFSMQKKGKIRLVIIIAAVIALLIYAYQSNLFNVRTYIEDSPIYQRFFNEDSSMEIDQDTRMEAKLYHLQNMGRYLFGGANIKKEFGYAHDILLDTYDEAGVFALIGIIGYLLVSFVHLLKCLKDKSLPFAFRNIVLCIYTVVYLDFMIEPILQGMPWLFATFCLIDGYVSRVISHNRFMKLRGQVSL